MTSTVKHLVCVTDIFGRTPAVDELMSSFESHYLLSIVEPYAAKFMDFGNEQLAYQYFTEHIGLVAYIGKLQAHIQSLTGDVYLLGFSVGAAAIWALSANNQLGSIKQAWIFYGSQIRHYQCLTPTFPITLYFPQSEMHFSVTELATNLQHKSHVKIEHTTFLHGFMNRYSANFNITTLLPEVLKVLVVILNSSLSAALTPAEPFLRKNGG